MRLSILAVILAVGAAACRDEQAGPKPKVARPTGPQALDAVPTDLTFKSGATWAGGAIVYWGTRLNPPVSRPGQQVQVTHYFSTTTQVPTGFMFFAHLVEPNSMQQVANIDHEIQQGTAPLGTWPVGKIIEDTSTITVPDVPGGVRLMFGFWNDRGRLPIDNVEQTDGEGRMKGPIVGGTGEGAPSAPKVPEYQIHKTAKAPTIDGKIDDASWSAAEEKTLVQSFDGRGTTLKTTFRMLYDDQNIYVAFKAEDPDVWGTLRKKDDPIYTEECMEVFLDADGDGKTYNELQVSPHNVNFDASFVTMRSDLQTAMAWESGMKTAVQIQGTLDDDKRDEGWTAEMQIPIKNLNSVLHTPPQKGDVWRFNAYRLEHLVRGRDVEGQAFSPLGVGDFHYLPKFGRLVFQ